MCEALLDPRRSEPERRERLHALVAFAGARSSRTAVASRRRARRSSRVILGDDARGGGARGTLQARGFDVRAIRPPTVPEGTARLRISLTLNVDERRSTAHGRRARRGAGGAPSPA